MAGGDRGEGGRSALLGSGSPPAPTKLSEIARELLEWTPRLDLFPDTYETTDLGHPPGLAQDEQVEGTNSAPPSPLLRPSARTPSADPTLPDGFIASRAALGRASAPGPPTSDPGSWLNGGGAPRPPGSAAEPGWASDPTDGARDADSAPSRASVEGLDEIAAYAEYQHSSGGAARDSPEPRRHHPPVTGPYSLYIDGDGDADSNPTPAADESVGHSYRDGPAGGDKYPTIDRGDLDGRWDARGSDADEEAWELGENDSAARSTVLWHGHGTPLARSWGSMHELEAGPEDDEGDETDDDDYEFSEPAQSSPLEDPRRRGLYYPGSDDGGDRRRERERERERSSSLLNARAAIGLTVGLTLVIVLVSAMTLLTAAAVLVRQDEPQASQPSVPSGSKGASGTPAQAPGTRCNTKSSTAPPPGANGGNDGPGAGGDGTGSAGGDARHRDAPGLSGRAPARYRVSCHCPSVTGTSSRWRRA